MAAIWISLLRRSSGAGNVGALRLNEFDGRSASEASCPSAWDRILAALRKAFSTPVPEHRTGIEILYSGVPVRSPAM
jgi:hypothetical protein